MVRSEGGCTRKKTLKVRKRIEKEITEHSNDPSDQCMERIGVDGRPLRGVKNVPEIHI